MSLTSIKTTNSEGVDVPSLNIDFDDLRRKMETFKTQFDGYLTNNKDKVIEARNEFNISMSKSKDKEKTLLFEMESLHQKEGEISKERTKEQQELEETKRAINDYSLKKEQMIDTQRTLEKQINDLRQAIAKVKEDQSRIKQTIIEESTKDIPELALWETTLGLTMEGISEDVIKFTFTNIDSDREFSCVLDLSERDYKVVSTNPELNQEIIERIVHDLNKSRKPNLFLRDIRREFTKVE